VTGSSILWAILWALPAFSEESKYHVIVVVVAVQKLEVSVEN